MYIAILATLFVSIHVISGIVTILNIVHHFSRTFLELASLETAQVCKRVSSDEGESKFREFKSVRSTHEPTKQFAVKDVPAESVRSSGYAVVSSLGDLSFFSSCSSSFSSFSGDSLDRDELPLARMLRSIGSSPAVLLGLERSRLLYLHGDANECASDANIPPCSNREC